MHGLGAGRPDMAGQAAAKMVALLGVSGSGKSAIARRMATEHGFTPLRFGDPARDMLKAGFGITDEELEGDTRSAPQARFGGLSVADIQNSLTGAWGRGCHPGLWTFEFERRAQAIAGPIVCEDIIRNCEADTVRRLGGIVVLVHRPNWVPRHLKAAERIADVRPDLTITTNGRGSLAALADELVAGLREVA